jgi:hypothetical protein
MMHTHIITTLAEGDEAVIRATESQTRCLVHYFPLIEKSSSVKSICEMIKLVEELPLRVGENIFLIITPDDCIEEHVILASLHRRLYDAIHVFVMRGNNPPVHIPWLPSLEETDKPIDTNYSYSPPACDGSGSCGSCSRH